MLPLVLAGAAFVGAAVVRRLDPDCQIEDNLDKAFDPTLSPRERQKAYETAIKVDGKRYEGEDFRELERDEINFVAQRKRGYEQVCTKLDTAFKNGAISQHQYQALSGQYKAAIKEMDNWLNK
ncbi:hypothetical protein [Mastigocoleus testarum]|uniref:Uncharacterized protein n=1 Tax=Mastigocoleus testarum BC008 TaxID=371196 RepID=A0A0V7ZG79_9CYAN|nr:hypothetical protein [Mastigocoleus testarum]KST63518.1 hypothetical protein BC008_13725 [Mastigocoleus testarum BC008]